VTSQEEANQVPSLDLSVYRDLFLDEAQAFLTILRQSLARLADHPDDREAWQEARRAAHTLKGMSSTMRYERLFALAQALEAPFLSDAPLAIDQIDVVLAGCEEFEHSLDR
jgi:chemotaxis protein histidine kinase CheA